MDDALKLILEEVQKSNQLSHQALTQLRESKDQQLSDLPTAESLMEQMAPAIKRMIEEAQAATEPPPAQGAPAPFRDFGDFCERVVRGDMPTEYQALNSSAIQMAQTTSATAGGYLVPDEFKARILEIAMELSIVRPRATVIPMGTDSCKIPAWNQESHAVNFYGGVLGYWVGEGSPITPTDAAFKEVSLTVNALAGLNYQSIRLLKASPLGVASLIERGFSNVIRFMEDEAFISGAGTTQPVGIIGADCEVAVNRAGAADIVTADVVGMYARFMGSLANAVWIANQTTIPKLFNLDDANDNSIWAPSAVPGLPGTLLGIPIVFSEKAPALGTKGDLILADFQYYLIGDLDELVIDYSDHVRFANLEGAMRMYKFVDGKPWMSTTYTPRKGSALSPFVILN